MPFDDRLWMKGCNLCGARVSTRLGAILGWKEPQCQGQDAPFQLPALRLGVAAIPGCQRCWSNIDSPKYLCPQGDADLISHGRSRCQARPPYGREINCQHVPSERHHLLLAQWGGCRGSHTQRHSQALSSLPSSSFVTYLAQVLEIKFLSMRPRSALSSSQRLWTAPAPSHSNVLSSPHMGDSELCREAALGREEASWTCAPGP